MLPPVSMLLCPLSRLRQGGGRLLHQNQCQGTLKEAWTIACEFPNYCWDNWLVMNVVFGFYDQLNHMFTLKLLSGKLFESYQ